MSPQGTAAFTLTQPITLTVAYSDTDVLHLDVNQLALRLWDEAQGVWQPLQTTVDPISRVIAAHTQELGDFDLQAPLLCATDALEPDDSYAARAPWYRTVPRWRVAWIYPNIAIGRVSTRSVGQRYVIRTQNLADGVDTLLNLYDIDGLTLLANNDNAGVGPASELRWTAPYTGTFFVEVASVPGGTTGVRLPTN